MERVGKEIKGALGSESLRRGCRPASGTERNEMELIVGVDQLNGCKVRLSMVARGGLSGF